MEFVSLPLDNEKTVYVFPLKLMSEMNLSELLINLNELIDFQGLMNSQLVTAFTFDLKSVKET